MTSGSSTSGSMFSNLQDLPSSTSQTGTSSLTKSSCSFSNLHTRDVSLNQETSMGFPELVSSSSMPLSLGTKGIMGLANLEAPVPASLNQPRRFSTYPERISTTVSVSFSDGASLSMVSPKLSRSDALAVTEPGILPAINGGATQPHKALQPDIQQGSSFTPQLFQRTLVETLDSFQKSIHEDMRSLHIEVLRQFHMQEVCMQRSQLLFPFCCIYLWN